MPTLAFDTHALIKQLKESGFEEEQAEALSDALKKAHQTYLEELVNKGDLKEVETALERDIKELETFFKKGYKRA